LQSEQCCNNSNDITSCATYGIHSSAEEANNMQENNGDSKSSDGVLHVQLKAFFAHRQHRRWEPFLCCLHGCSYLIGSVSVLLRPGHHGLPEASRDQGNKWEGLETLLEVIEAEPEQAELVRCVREIELVQATE
jgi:hypothetical protein